MRHFFHLALVMAVIATPVFASAQAPNAKAQGPDYSAERKQFEEAKKALARGKTSSFRKITATLEHYPLHPYLEYAYIASHLYSTKPATIDAFLTKYDDSSLGKRLRYIWLEHLQRRKKSQLFLQYYESERATISQQCFAHLSQYRNGQQQLAIAASLELWQVGKSHPKACDPIFAILIKQKLITEDVAWHRFTSALDNNETRLARYLQRFFTSDDKKQQARLYYDTYTTPSKIKQHSNYQQNTADNKQLIENSISRLTKQSAISALAQWKYYSRQFEFSEQQQNSVIQNLVKSLYKQNHDGIADDLLRKSDNASTTTLVEWRIRQALAILDWASVRYWIRQLPLEKQQHDRWTYWLARAEQELTNNGQSQQQIFSSLAEERSFFGYLAADRTNKPYLLKDSPVEIAPNVLNSAKTNPSLQRAHELFLVNEITNARREWKYATQNNSQEFMIAASKLAGDWGWHSQAAYGIVISKQWDDLSLRFPADFIPLYQQYSSKYDLPLELMLALSRQESSFATDALSPSGAKGLMQLMPKTAKYIARKSKTPYRYEKQLYEAEKNIALGTAYYRYLMDDFEDNRILSTSSYNAGPNRTRQWLKKSEGKLPPDVWIEIIPFTETRRYVQNVLYFSVVYGQRQGKTVQLFTAKEAATAL